MSAIINNSGPKIWDFDTGEIIFDLNAANIFHGLLAISPNNKYISLLMDDIEREDEDNLRHYKILVWDTENYNIVRTLCFCESELITSIALSSDGNTLIYSNDKIKFRNINQNRVIKTINDFGEFVISDDGRFIAVTNNVGLLFHGEHVGHVNIWDVSKGTCIYSITPLEENPFLINSLAFGNNNQLYTSEGNNLKKWDFPTLQDLIDSTKLIFKDRQLTPEDRRKYYLE